MSLCLFMRKCCSWTREKTIVHIFLVYLLVAIILVPYIGQDLPFSVFYQSSKIADRDKNIQDNTKRLQVAERTLLNYKLHREKNTVISNDDTIVQTEFCFVVVSVSRPAKVHFLTQVVAALQPQLVDSNSVFTIYNAEGESHSEAMGLADTVSVITMEGGKKASNTYNKEKEDYVHALKWCNEKNSKFTVVLEDDALPYVDFMSRLRFVLQSHLSHYQHKWAFLKLFYPPRWQGWSNEMDIIQELISTSIVGGLALTILTYFLQFVLNRGRLKRPGLLGILNFIMRFLLSSCLALYMLLALGRPHWLVFLGNISPRLMFVVPAPGCCTPAVLYPRQHLAALIDYLDKTVCSAVFPIDLALDKFAVDKGLDKLLVLPNLVKHIGFVSSLGKGWKNPREFRF